jgi:hypothetical protein
MRDRHAPVSDTDQCAHRGAIGSCSGWIVGHSEVIQFDGLSAFRPFGRNLAEFLNDMPHCYT